MKKYYMKNNCIDCNKICSYNAIRCRKCQDERRINLIKGNGNPFFGKYHNEKTKDKIRNSKYHKNLNGKNNGFFSKKHSKESIEKMRKKALGRRHTEESKKKMRGRLAPHGKHIKYKGINMRSTWEVLYAKWLDKHNIIWTYESKVFDLGNSTYRPDFYLPKTNRYIEIKGYWRDDANYKFNRFKRLYPNTKIELLMKSELQELGVL